MRYLLDTNICIYIMKRQPAEVRDRLRDIPVGAVGISSIVLAELWHGVCKSQRRRQNEAALSDFLVFCAVEEWPVAAAKHYGEIRAELEREGKIIGGNDLLIAAHALQARATLVTNNMAEFHRVQGLSLENWVDA